MSTAFRTATLLALLLGCLAPALHADDLDFLLQEFDVVRERVDDDGLAQQQDLLRRIADVDTPRSRKKLLALRKEWAGTNWRRQVMALDALVRRGDAGDLDEALRWVEANAPKGARPPLVLWRLGDILAGAQDPAARAHLRGKALKRARPDIRIQILRSFGRTKDEEAVPALVALLDEWHPETRLEAIIALGEVGDPAAAEHLAKHLRAKDDRERMLAAEALGRLGGPEATAALCPALADPEPRVVEAAAEALAGQTSPTCIPELIAAMTRTYPDELRTADACAAALEAISGKAFGIDAEAWTSWWEAVRDRPFVKDDTPPTDRTVPGIPYYGFRIRSSRVAFVLDTSKSMEWNDRLESAKRELTRVVESLPETTRFNLVTFGSDVHAWEDRVQVASKRLVEKAVKFIARQTPHGGTSTHDALVKAFDVPKGAKSAEIADTIVFLSDGSPSEGEVTDPDAILAEVREWNRYRRLRILCIGLLTGDPPGAFRAQEDAEKAEAFLRRLAEENGGTAEIIR